MNWVLALLLTVTAAAEAPTKKTTTARSRCMVALKEYRGHYGRTLDAVRAALKHHAPELLRRTPRGAPLAKKPGYGVLPPLMTPRAPGPPGDDAHRSGGMTYSWDLTAQYAAREVQALEEVSEKLAAVKRLDDAADRRAILKGVVEQDLPQLERGLTLVDRHEKHNVFWQAEISAHRKNYEEGTRLFHLVREGKGRDEIDHVRFRLQCAPPALVKEVADSGDGRSKSLIITVHTDITDRAWLARFQDAVERMWSVHGVNTRILWKYFTPRPRPRPGSAVAEAAHVARFPKGAVLTTGAAATHALPCRAVVLGPFELEETVAAHEFGHILGFGDAYFRGFRELGPGDGLEILEIIPDAGDLMAMPESGVVLPGHIEALIR